MSYAVEWECTCSCGCRHRYDTSSDVPDKICAWCEDGHNDRCDICGAELRIGEWPFCPHGDARYFGEEPLEPYIDHNLGPEPVEIRTRGERRAIMSRNHLEYNDVSKKLRGRLYVDLHRR